MNDPHVVSLTYRIDKAETVDFDKAPSLTVDRGAFRVTIDDYVAKIQMVDHFATVEEAQQIVQPFLRASELQADLHESWAGFRFVYATAEMRDRSRPIGAVILEGGSFLLTGNDLGFHVSLVKWPDPPQELEVSPDADTLLAPVAATAGRKSGAVAISRLLGTHDA